MQTCGWMPTSRLGRHAPQQTSCYKVPSPPAQEQYFSGQQRMSTQQNNQQSHGLWNAQSSLQPASSLCNMQLRQMPQVWVKNSQNQLLHQNSASMRATLPNRQSTQLHAAQHGTPIQNLSCHPQTMSTNTVPKQSYNISSLYNVNNSTPAFWISSANSNASSAPEQNNLTHQSVPAQYQSLSGHHNQMLNAPHLAAQFQQPALPNQAPQTMHANQGQRMGGNGAFAISVNHSPTTSQPLITPSQPSSYNFQTGWSHSSHNRNQVQHSSQIQHPPPPYRKENNSATYSHLNHKTKMLGKQLQHLTHSSLSTNQNFITQSQPIQNQSLSPDSVHPQAVLQPCNTRQVSSHHTNGTLSAIQGSTQPQDLQLTNTASGLAFSTHNRIGTSTLTSGTPSSSYVTSTQNSSQLTLNNLLMGMDKTEVSVQSHGTTSALCLGAMQVQTPTNTSYSQIPESAPYSCTPATLLNPTKEHQRVSEDQTAVKKSDLLTEQQHALCNQLKTLDVQITEGMQSRKLQAVSSTARKDGHEQNNQPGEAQNSEPPELTELLMALQKMLRQSAKAVAVVPPISQQVSTLEKNDSVTPNSDNNAIWTLNKDSKNFEQESNAQNLPKKTTENFSPLDSGTHHETQEKDKPRPRSTFDSLQQDAKCSDVPQSKTGPTVSQDHTLETDKPSGSVSDFSNVQVFSFTVEVLKYWVRFLESTVEGRIKEPVADLIKCLIDLYWGGKIENLGKCLRIFTEEITSLYSKISVEELQMAQFQYFRPKDLKKIQHSYHILNNDTNTPTVEFGSSWLNIDGQPADIENVLAEPILDLMDYSLYSNFNPLKMYSESGPSTEMIPSPTVNQKGDQPTVNQKGDQPTVNQKGDQPTVNQKMVHEELVNDQVYESKSTEEVSNRKEGEENLEKPNQQDATMNPEQSTDSNEIADIMTESKGKSESDEVSRDATEVTTTKTTEHKDLCNGIDSSNESFKKYTNFDLQKDHDGAKGSAPPDNESHVVCSSAHQIKFTCPHMSNIEVDWDDKHFCPMCWEETPLLNLDLEEAPLSPKTAGLNMSTPQNQGHPNQSCSPQSDNSDLDWTILSEGSSIADSPSWNIDVFEMTLSEPGPTPSEAILSCTSPSGKLPIKGPHAPVFIESVSCAMLIEQGCETNGSVGPKIPTAQSCAQNLENLDILKQVKTTRDEACPPEIQPCKRIKVTKTVDIPVEDLNNVGGDIVPKKCRPSKQNPSEINGTPAKDGQNCINERKGKVKSPVMMKIQSNTPCPQSAKPDLNVKVGTESYSNSSYPVNKAIREPNPNLGVSVPCCSPASGKAPDKEEHGRVRSESLVVSMSTKQDCKAHKDLNVSFPIKLSLSKKLEKRKLVIPSQTKTSKNKVCSPAPPLYKKLKVIKTTTRSDEDDLFTPDSIVKKGGSTKQNPSGLSRVSLTEDTHHWENEKARGDNQQSSAVSKRRHKEHSHKRKMDGNGNESVKFQVPKVTGRPKGPANVHDCSMTKGMVPGKVKQTQPNKEKKKRLKFVLYGLSGQQNKCVQHEGETRKKSTAPVYITIANRSETTNSYSDVPSAKQKVFSQWSSTFVETKKTSSHKKRQKTVEEELKSKTDVLKRHVKDRFAKKSFITS